MLRFFVLAAQIPIVGLAIYNAMVALWGWRTPPAHGAPTGGTRLRVVIPAHNEQSVIGGLIGDIERQTYPTDLFTTVVIADRCTDATATLVRAPARVMERNEGTGAKGAAIQWLLDREPLAQDEVLVILDADNRIDPTFLASVAAAIDDGNDVVQCYLDVVNPDASPLATASALSYWASNRMVQLARTNLGWPCDLGGTGTAITGAALEDAGGLADDLVEDQALGVRLALAGYTARWEHRIRVRDEKPTDVTVAITQRARWMSGRRALARRSLPVVLRRAVERRSAGLFDLALRMIQPSRTFLALVAAILAVSDWATGSPWLLDWRLWAFVAVLSATMPIPFLIRDGVPGRYVVRYPVLIVLAALWVPVRIASSLVGDRWRPTPHKGT